VERCHWAVSNPDVGSKLQKRVTHTITARVGPPRMPMFNPNPCQSYDDRTADNESGHSQIGGGR
jgi:hypothetical protein